MRNEDELMIALDIIKTYSEAAQLNGKQLNDAIDKIDKVKDDLLNSIMESLSRIQYIKSADIPNIDLYMDQVTTFMESKLKNTSRNPEADKILTKTMINNYTKNNLLPPPVKKKYYREHLLLLVFIYYFKNILSIKDIETVLAPLTEKYFPDGSSFELADIYKEVLFKS